MYVHPAFKVHPAASLAFAAARGFGLVIACDGGPPVASLLPFRRIEAAGKVSDRKREMLLKAIVAVEMTVESIEGSFKLNQHKSDEDHVAIASALAQQDDPSAQAIAKRMIALRPHLDYAPLVPVIELAG